MEGEGERGMEGEGEGEGESGMEGEGEGEGESGMEGEGERGMEGEGERKRDTDCMYVSAEHNKIPQHLPVQTYT